MNLLLKQLTVGTAVGRLGERIRWILRTPQRIRHPELWDMYLEDRRTSLALPELVRGMDTCIDVGAHVGSKLAEFRKLAPDGSHVAFEPVPSKARWLRRRFKGVLVVEAATSDEGGSGRFYIDLERPGFSGLTKPVGESKTKATEVRLVRLDDELADCARIDFLKLDVEGAELPTLRGAEKILDRHRPRLLFECGTDPQLERFDYRRVDLYDFLSGHDYDVYLIVDFVYGRPPLTREGFELAGTYPYRGFNYVALPAGTPVKRIL